MGKILQVNLTTREYGEYTFPKKYRQEYLGAKGMAARIIYDLCPPMTQPFSRENILVVSTGPLTGTGVPSSSRFNISTISPLTGLYTSSNCGGPLGLNLRKCGVDALIITGESQTPVYIDVSEEGLEVKDATHLWGLSTEKTSEALKKPSAVIGVAGENLVHYACVISADRAAGRGGTGAIFGYKKLKGICAKGNAKIDIAHPEKFKKYNQRWIKRLKNHVMTGDKCGELGTAMLVKPLQKHGQLATKNFDAGRYDEWEKLSGETLKKDFLVKNKGCITCPIRCARVVKIGEKQVKGPELETIALWGSNMLNSDMQKIIELNYLMDELGMDTMSAAGSVAFAMELKEKGIADFGVEFGKMDNMEQVLEDIAHRRGIMSDLADGSRQMSKKYGGTAFAMHVKGMELAAYEPRGAYGQGLSYATANRGGCHLNGGYQVLLEGFGAVMKTNSTRSKAPLAIMFQDLMEAVSAMGCCLFTTYAVLPSFMYKGKFGAKSASVVLGLSAPFVGFAVKNPALLKVNMIRIPYSKAFYFVTGHKMNLGKMLEAGQRCYNLEREINFKQGLHHHEDDLPLRLKTPRKEDGHAVPVSKMLVKYYKIRGWDKSGRLVHKRRVKLFDS